MNTKRNIMDTQTILIIIVVGIAAGMLGGMVGVGGGIIIVPALVYFLGFNQHTAQGTSLGLIMLPVGILGFLQYYNTCKLSGQPIDFKVIGILAIGFVIGSYFGSKISLGLSVVTIKKVFACLLILIAIKMLFFDKEKKESVANQSSNNKEINLHT
jgi:uncharacterized membrane protein YfcA